ncbi:MAG: hypothetical protein ABL921_29980, partial [Pirellula sp.]
IVDWSYDEAVNARAKGKTPEITLEDVEKFLLSAAATTNTALPDELRGPLILAVELMAKRMIELALANRNGIWAFILRNTYRPGLLSGQFNGLVSNPPWLALSALAENPYKEALNARAKSYGIRPPGQSFLHLELGTTHLLHAVDRYLKAGASVACLVPGTIFNGHHHEPFRRFEFLNSKRPVALEILEVWQVAPGTFKYPGAAIIGYKHSNDTALGATPPAGFVARPDVLESADLSIRTIGTERTAWVLEREGLPVISTGMTELPQQGADLMPRTALCVEILNEGGVECRVDTPQRDTRWGFTIKAAKELKGERFAGHVAPQFLYRIAQSENLLPFLLGDNRAPIAIPAERDGAGIWQIYDEATIRGQGFTETARRFQAINTKLGNVGQGKTLQQRIDERGKLSKQVFGTEGYLIVAGAGGKHICAACLPIAEAHNLVIDQTLYWKVIENPDEAWFCVGMLNSQAMTTAITPFNPQGAFGERHIHALPYRLMPAFDASNEEHLQLAVLAREAAAIASAIVARDSYIGDPNRALTSRRTKLRTLLMGTKQLLEMEILCAAALGTGAVNEEAVDAGDGVEH